MGRKFLFLKPFLLTRSNGAERSLIEYFQWLLSEGHDVQVHIVAPSICREECKSVLQSLGTPLVKDVYRIGGVKCIVHFGKNFEQLNPDHQSSIEKKFQEIIDYIRPDFVMTHYTDFFSTTTALKWNPDRALVFITDDEYPRLKSLHSFHSIAEAYFKLKHIVVASPFLKASAKKSFPYARIHYYPNRIEGLDRKPNQRLGRFWVLVNPCPQKGSDFAVALARRLPEERFLFLDYWGTYSKVDLPKNIVMLPTQKFIWEVLSKAKGVIVPSHWNEGFGRVALEAMAAGVPVVASTQGNLPDTVGDGGLCLTLDLELWISTLKSPDSFWQSQIQKGFRRLHRFQTRVNRRFKILSSYLAKLDQDAPTLPTTDSNKAETFRLP